jgi:hypothetical protein
MLAGLVVGVLIAATGMGAGPDGPGADRPVRHLCGGRRRHRSALLGHHKGVGSLRHLSLNTVNTDLARWMALGSVPASLAGVSRCTELIGGDSAAMESWLGLKLFGLC